MGFTRELYQESHGEFGVMTGFHDEGPIAFAWITYPLCANTYGLLLVNGRHRPFLTPETRDRGKLVNSNLAPHVLATVHPSSILRARDDESRRLQLQAFIEDLRRVARVATRT